MSSALRRQLLRYGVVGGLGFAVDAGLLYVLASWGADPYASRLISFAVALTVTWALNRAWTFEVRGRAAAGKSYLGYALVQLLGALTNFVVYAGVLSLIGPTPAKAVLALAFGSAVGLAVNFTGARFVFTRVAAAGPAERT